MADGTDCRARRLGPRHRTELGPAQTANRGSPRWSIGVRRCASARSSRPRPGSRWRRSRRDHRRRRPASRGSPWSGTHGSRTCTRTSLAAARPADLAEHLDRAHEVVDRHAAHDRVERLVSEGQHRVSVEVVHDRGGRGGVGRELVLVHPEDREAGRCHPEVRHPRPHEVEDVAVDAQLVVEGTDRGDGAVVDVGDEPGHRVETRRRARDRRGRRIPAGTARHPRLGDRRSAWPWRRAGGAEAARLPRSSPPTDGSHPPVGSSGSAAKSRWTLRYHFIPEIGRRQRPFMSFKGASWSLSPAATASRRCWSCAWITSFASSP